MKKRLDVLVCEQNPEMSKSRAQAIIMSGTVYVDGQKETKSGSMFPEDTIVEVRDNSLKYVSRGGLKLEKAMQEFPVDLKGKVCMDIGSSTGGFTDCMLQNGAERVYAVDVGKGQLHYKLREDERVVVMEKTNIRYVTPEDIPEKIQFASVDVSFISLSLVLPAALPLLDARKELVMLIKPQFEAGREKVGKKGVVREPKVHKEVIEKTVDIAEENGLTVSGLSYSPVKGPEGNIEYLIHVLKSAEPKPFDKAEIDAVVEAAHNALD
ncbi:MAG: TlyA family RNA methyltransferase [Lachnospiraceae bacterium]|nr:TlyA family RNA methyltransferase [Lachnospiraceae bacterium]